MHQIFEFGGNVSETFSLDVSGIRRYSQYCYNLYSCYKPFELFEYKQHYTATVTYDFIMGIGMKTLICL